MKITIYMKKEDDLVTPDVIRLVDVNITTSNNNNEIFKAFGAQAQPTHGSNIYFMFKIDSEKAINSQNYDYYLKVVNETESIVMIDNDAGDYLKLDLQSNNINYGSFASLDDNGYWKYKATEGTDYKVDDSITVIQPHIYLKKTLKDRPERCKGGSDHLFITPLVIADIKVITAITEPI